jgi:hypothetical protein
VSAAGSGFLSKYLMPEAPAADDQRPGSPSGGAAEKGAAADPTQDCARRLRAVEREVIDITTCMRCGREEQGFIRLAKLFGAIGELVATIGALHRRVALEGGRLPGGDPSRLYAPLLAHLEEMRAAHEAGDVVLITDLLGFEILPLLGRMTATLRDEPGSGTRFQPAPPDRAR